MTTDIRIVTASVADAPALTALSIKTFWDTFAADNKTEDMEKYIAEDMSEERITQELRDKHNVFFLGYRGDMLIAYAKVRSTKIPEALKNNRPIELERIYVLQEHLGTKAGAALLQHCINYAVANNNDVLWLGVWEHNHRAINFYKRWGFDFFSSHTFKLGDDIQTDVLMKKELR